MSRRLKCLSSRALNYGRSVFSRTCRKYGHFAFRSPLKVNVDTLHDNKISNVFIYFLFSSFFMPLLVWPHASCIRGNTRFVELHISQSRIFHSRQLVFHIYMSLSPK